MTTSLKKVDETIYGHAPGKLHFPIDQITIDKEFQSRAETSEEHIEQYKIVLENGGDFEEDRVEIWIIDGIAYLIHGWHRYEAHKRARVSHIWADVKFGTREDALFHCEEVNTKNGLPLTLADRKNILFRRFARGQKITVNGETAVWGQASSGLIAHELHITKPTAQNWIEEYQKESGGINLPPVDRTRLLGPDGKWYDNATRAALRDEIRAMSDDELGDWLDTHKKGDDGYGFASDELSRRIAKPPTPEQRVAVMTKEQLLGQIHAKQAAFDAGNFADDPIWLAAEEKFERDYPGESPDLIEASQPTPRYGDERAQPRGAFQPRGLSGISISNSVTAKQEEAILRDLEDGPMRYSPTPAVLRLRNMGKIRHIGGEMYELSTPPRTETGQKPDNGHEPRLQAVTAPAPVAPAMEPEPVESGISTALELNEHEIKILLLLDNEPAELTDNDVKSGAKTFLVERGLIIRVGTSHVFEITDMGRSAIADLQAAGLVDQNDEPDAEPAPKTAPDKAQAVEIADPSDALAARKLLHDLTDACRHDASKVIEWADTTMESLRDHRIAELGSFEGLAADLRGASAQQLRGLQGILEKALLKTEHLQRDIKQTQHHLKTLVGELTTEKETA